MSKIIELAKKIKALADRGVGGEKINAELLLKDIMAKHNITLDMLEEAVEDLRFIEIDLKYRELLVQLSQGIRRDMIVYIYNQDRVKKDKLTGNAAISCTYCEFVEIQAKFDHYSVLFDQEFKVFARAFFVKNNLLIEPDEDYIPSPELEEVYVRAYEMADQIKKHDYNKRLT